jgi:hypothetical protein
LGAVTSSLAGLLPKAGTVKAAIAASAKPRENLERMANTSGGQPGRR